MNANINFPQVVAGLKSVVGLASLAMISVGVLRAFGINVPWFNIGNLELAALAAAAAFISH